MCLNSVDWEDLLNFDLFGLEDAVKIFYEVLHVAIDLAVPKFGVFKSKFPIWYTDELKQNIFVKKAVH